MVSAFERPSLNRSASLGFLLLMPSLLFLAMMASKVVLGFTYFYEAFEAAVSNPVVFKIWDIGGTLLLVGGAFAALVLNVLAVSRLNFMRVHNRLTSVLTITGNPWNMAVIAASALIFLTYIFYFIVENLNYWARGM